MSFSRPIQWYHSPLNPIWPQTVPLKAKNNWAQIFAGDFDEPRSPFLPDLPREQEQQVGYQLIVQDVAQGSDSTRVPPQKNGWGQRPTPTTNQRPALSTNQDADRRVETIEGAAGQAGNALSSNREKGVYCVIMVKLGDKKRKSSLGME
jgi:hypothetical protein